MKERFKYKFDELFNSLVTANHNLGGLASVEELAAQFLTILCTNILLTQFTQTF